MRKGNTLVPALIVIGAMVVGVFVVALYMWPSSGDFNINVPVVRRASNSNVNTNTAVVNANTNTTNANSNTTITATNPAQSWDWTTNDTALYIKNNVYQLLDVSAGTSLPLAPAGYDVVWAKYTAKIIILDKDQQLFSFDRQTKLVHQLTLPTFLKGDVRFESPSVVGWSSDGAEVVIAYELFDKNSEEYKGEFAGPTPVSVKAYRYDIVNDTYVDGDAFTKNIDMFGSPRFSAWNRQTNLMYSFPSGEGVGNGTPIFSVNTVTDARKNYKTFPATSSPFFSDNGSHVAVLQNTYNPGVVTISLFTIDNLDVPYISFPLTRKATSGSAANGITWSSDYSKIAVTYDDRVIIVDTTTKAETTVYQDSTRGCGGLLYDRNAAPFSQSGKYVYVSDYSNPDTNNYNASTNSVTMRAISLTGGKNKILKTTQGCAGIKYY